MDPRRPTEQPEALQSGAWATRPPLRCGDLEEVRPHKIISNRQRDQSEEASNFIRYKEIVRQRRAMIQQSLGCDDPDPSVCEAAGAGEADGPRGPWSIRREPEWKTGRGGGSYREWAFGSIKGCGSVGRVGRVIGRSPVRIPAPPSCISWARYWTPNCSWWAVGALHGSLCHQCMNVCLNGWMWHSALSCC